MKKFTFPFFLLFFLLGVSDNLLSQTVEWLTWEEAVTKSKEAPRKIFVDIYTDWCAYCKKMDRETFSNAYVAKYLNEKFYPVKLNAQQKNDITFQNKIYRFVDRGGRNSYHELAAMIMNGRLSYPTIVFLDEHQNLIQSIPGYRNAFEFELFITYFGENHHKETPWSSYKRQKPKGIPSAAPQINVKGN
jgi:thioredoxin-related protein